MSEESKALDRIKINEDAYYPNKNWYDGVATITAAQALEQLNNYTVDAGQRITTNAALGQYVTYTNIVPPEYVAIPGQYQIDMGALQPRTGYAGLAQAQQAINQQAAQMQANTVQYSREELERMFPNQGAAPTILSGDITQQVEETFWTINANGQWQAQQRRG